MGIDHTIYTRTVASATDKRCLVLAEKPLARTLAIGSSWTSILIGVHFGIETLPDNSASDKVFYLGMISGTSQLPTVTASTVSNFVGVKTDPASSYIAQTGGYGYHKAYPHKIVSGTGTSGTSQYIDVKNATSGRGAWFLKITKGSPNYTISLWFSGTTTEMSTDNFKAQMLSGTPSGSGIINPINAVSFAASESSGVLDTVCFAFSNSTYKVECINIYPRVLS